jgi:hypothetical protein
MCICSFSSSSACRIRSFSSSSMRIRSFSALLLCAVSSIASSTDGLLARLWLYSVHVLPMSVMSTSSVR